MSRLELLNSRGFRDEKHLEEFLKNCKDESWKKELIEYFGVDTKPKKSKEDKKVIDETPKEENIKEE